LQAIEGAIDWLHPIESTLQLLDNRQGYWGSVVMRTIAVFALAVLCSGCARNEVVQFQPKPQQEALVRDGNPGLVSRQKSSIVIVRPATRQFVSGSRPVFVVGINNLTNVPQQFRVSDIQVVQIVDGQTANLKVITYEELVSEEHTRQVFAAVATGLAAGANAYSASQAGRYNSTSTVQTPHGTYLVNTTGYSPTANAIAQANASARNEAMIAKTIERGQQNMAALEREVIKDNTMMPGEWYGGQLHVAPLVSSSDGPKAYSISIMVGADRHEINIVQNRAN
jgi:hypothetical protein